MTTTLHGFEVVAEQDVPERQYSHKGRVGYRGPKALALLALQSGQWIRDPQGDRKREQDPRPARPSLDGSAQ